MKYVEIAQSTPSGQKKWFATDLDLHRITPMCDSLEQVRVFTDAYDKGEPIHIYEYATGASWNRARCGRGHG